MESMGRKTHFTQVEHHFFTLYQEHIISALLIIVEVDLENLTDVVFVQIMHLNVLFSFPFHIVLFEQSPYVRPTLRQLCLNIEKLSKFFGILLHGRFAYFYPFIYLIMSSY
jgi:hypothetical protein